MRDVPDGAEILKTDALARVRTPLERRKQLLDEFERRGLSGVKFAVLAGVKYATFAGWVAKRRRARTSDLTTAAGPSAKVRWLEAAPGLEIQEFEHLVEFFPEWVTPLVFYE